MSDFIKAVSEVSMSAICALRDPEKETTIAGAMGFIVAWARNAQAIDHATGERGKLIFIGNGGSAAIASHMAIDWQNKAECRSMCFNDPAALTCIGNDHGYEDVFAAQVRHHADAGDMLFAISSSGRSRNMINAARAAKGRFARVVTITGFDPDNELRQLGHLNVWFPSGDYGVVECSSLIFIHAALSEMCK